MDSQRQIASGTRARKHAQANASLAPMRAEVFGIAQLEAHARAWAQQDRILPAAQGSLRLFPRLLDNERVLVAARNQYARATASPTSSAPPTADRQ